jgi:large subunit ribosomal protein L20
MARVKSGVVSKKRTNKILKQTKGFRYGRKSKIRAAKEALLHAGEHAIRGRKEKKRVNRRLWQTKINAFVRENDLTYSKFINLLKVKNVEIDRKVMADMCVKEPDVMKKIVEFVKK